MTIRSVTIWLLFVTASTQAQQPVKSPVAPKKTIENFKIHPQFKIDLVACEPNVIDPVAIRFDERGNLWVVEMRDYPHGPQDGEPPMSRIKILRDEDKDGFYETAHVFADRLMFATGVQPYKFTAPGNGDKSQFGVIVTLAGKVQWMSDTDGDFKADVVETWFTGFAEQNPQLRANDPTLGPDGWIYIANGLRNGTVKAVKPEWKDQPPITLRSQDFRFDPKTGTFEAISGYGQFGMTFDDAGNRFVCSNRNPCNHVVVPQKYLDRNPYLVRTGAVNVVSPAAGDSRVFAISKPWTTSTLHAGQFTAACGVTIYRGDAFPSNFYGNSFVCEPTGNLVHRDILIPDGPTFKSHYGREGTEFLASRDNWFRPVNLANGPDGNLYVADMYRAVIEHPQFMPDELKTRADLRSGDDRGRIYRISLAVGTPLKTELANSPEHFKDRRRTIRRARESLLKSYESEPKVAMANVKDPWHQQALLTQPPERSLDILRQLLDSGTKRGGLIRDLCKQIALRNNDEETAAALQAVQAAGGPQYDSLEGLAVGLRRHGKTLQGIAKRLPEQNRQEVAHYFELAVKAIDSSDDSVQATAVRMLDFAESEIARTPLLKAATEHESIETRIVAIENLRRFHTTETASLLLQSFTGETPRVQRAIVTSCVGNSTAAQTLVDAVVSKQLPPSILDSASQRVLRRYKQPKLKAVVTKALALLEPADRRQVLGQYASCRTLKADPKRGRDVFARSCATCHQIGTLGIDIGPDIADSRSKSAEYLLLHILDPNRAVDANYFSYTAVTDEGRVLTGIIASETASSVTLKQAEGKVTTLLRSNIDELKNNGVSLMPVGLEKAINKQQMADLISFIKNWRYLDGDIPINLR